MGFQKPRHACLPCSGLAATARQASADSLTAAKPRATGNDPVRPARTLPFHQPLSSACQ
jgi:hypothetical protein